MYYEKVDWQKIEYSQFKKDLAHSAYLEASRWATALQQSLMAMADSQEC
jgi:EAL and modified HD-GYP domain-containing signal transduction protein